MEYTESAKVKYGTIKDGNGNIVLNISGGELFVTTHRYLGETNRYFCTGDAYVSARELIRLDGYNTCEFKMLVEMDDTFVGSRGFLCNVNGVCSVATEKNTVSIIKEIEDAGDSHFEADGFYNLHINQIFATPADWRQLFCGETP